MYQMKFHVLSCKDFVFVEYAWHAKNSEHFKIQIHNDVYKGVP